MPSAPELRGDPLHVELALRAQRDLHPSVRHLAEQDRDAHAVDREQRRRELGGVDVRGAALFDHRARDAHGGDSPVGAQSQSGKRPAEEAGVRRRVALVDFPVAPRGVRSGLEQLGRDAEGTRRSRAETEEPGIRREPGVERVGRGGIGHRPLARTSSWMRTAVAAAVVSIRFACHGVAAVG